MSLALIYKMYLTMEPFFSGESWTGIPLNTVWEKLGSSMRCVRRHMIESQVGKKAGGWLVECLVYYVKQHWAFSSRQ